MKKIIYLVLIIIPLVFSSYSIAQKPNPAKKKTTVGDMLKRAKEDSRGGKAKLLQKGDTTLPQTQFNFKAREMVNLNSVKPPKSSELMKPAGKTNEIEYEKTLDFQILELYKLTQKFKSTPHYIITTGFGTGFIRHIYGA